MAFSVGWSPQFALGSNTLIPYDEFRGVHFLGEQSELFPLRIELAISPIGIAGGIGLLLAGVATNQNYNDVGGKLLFSGAAHEVVGASFGPSLNLGHLKVGPMLHMGMAPTIAPGVSTVGVYVGADLAIDYTGFGPLVSLEVGAGGMVPSDFSKKPWLRQLTRLNVVVPLDTAPAGDGFGVLLSAGWFVDGYVAQGTTPSSAGFGPTLNVGLAF